MARCYAKFKPSERGIRAGFLSHRDVKGYTPMHEAAFRGNDRLLQTLDAFKAPINIIDTSAQQETPLFKAVSFGMTTAVERLLKLGALPNMFNARGDTPLHIACCKTNVEVVDTLLNYGAKTDTSNRLGFTPVDVAEAQDTVEGGMILTLISYHENLRVEEEQRQQERQQE